MDRLSLRSPWEGPVGFFEEFRELSAQRRFASEQLPDSAVEMNNPVCGDQIRVWIEVDGGRIVAYGYQQRGCWPVVGCLELWGHLLPKLSVHELVNLELSELLNLVTGVPASKRHAFSLTLRAVQVAAVQAGVSRP